jgi:SAM-dependent methyltransferase/methyltransferase-like protein
MPPTAYDEVPYPSGAVDLTHPGHLAMLAQLYGMAPAPVERCRMLELGCGDGNNLLPLAELFPDSTFVGVDLAASPIAAGRAWAKRIGVTNLTLVEADLLAFDPGPEPFDYIVAHGLYSWVPHAVRDRAMAIFGRSLAPHGVAYVSYNALPGGYLRRAARDMMLFHTRDIGGHKERVAKARAFTAFVADAAPADAAVHKAVMAGQRDRIAALDDDYLVHDDLSGHNDPFYFHQVVEHAARHGLAYLAEARFAEMSDRGLPKPVRETLRGLGDVLAYEQTFDFVVGRSFRHTLLVRDDVALARPPDGSTLGRTFAVSAARPESPAPDIASPAVERFVNARGGRLSLSTPFTKAALTVLAAAAPRALSFDELLAAARARLGSADEDDAHTLGELLVVALSCEMVSLHAHRPRLAASPGARPRATKLAREQAAAGVPITTLDHRNLRDLDPFARRLLALLDGTRDRAALAAALKKGGGRGRVEETLGALARQGLILG